MKIRRRGFLPSEIRIHTQNNKSDCSDDDCQNYCHSWKILNPLVPLFLSFSLSRLFPTRDPTKRSSSALFRDSLVHFPSETIMKESLAKYWFSWRWEMLLWYFGTRGKGRKRGGESDQARWEDRIRLQLQNISFRLLVSVARFVLVSPLLNL